MELLELFSHKADFADYHRIEVMVSRLRSKVLSLSGLKLPLRSEYGQGLSFVGNCVIKR